MSTEWKHASWVSTLGKWAWIIVILNGIIEIIYNIVLIAEIAAWNAAYPLYQIPVPFFDVWNLIWGIIIIVIGYAIIRPKFSEKCAAQDWDALYDWYLNLGDLKIPWMLIWGFIIEIFSFWWWGGLSVLIPAFVLLFAGPKPYEWKSTTSKIESDTSTTKTEA